MYEVLFQNSYFTLKTLNLLLLAGFIFAGIFSMRYTERHKMNSTFLIRYFPHLFMGAIIGGRLFYLLENWSTVIQNPIASLYLWDLNYSFFGSIVGLFGILYLLTKKGKENFWSWVDVITLSVIAIMIFTHFGFLLSGDYYGSPTDLPWGISFTTDKIPFIIPIHPIQLYASLVSLILLGYSVKQSKRTHLPGVIGTRALALYSIAMLGIDFLRGDPTLFLYTKIAYGAVAALSFIASVHCSHQTHIKD